MDREARARLYEEMAEGLSRKYNQIRAAGVDTSLVGAAGEGVLTDWITEWLPRRMSVVKGAVLSIKDDPTDQMDCLLFDSFETPVYTRLAGSDLVPIEGVSGAVEVNSGQNTTYQKLLTDAAKLSRLRGLTESGMARPSIALSHQPPDSDPNETTVQQLIEGIQFHRGFDGPPLTLIFAENIQGNLEEAATRVARHNYESGVDRSVDGLFILDQGFALHVDQRQTVWTSQRLSGSEFAYLSATPGQILHHLQSTVLNLLYQRGKTHPRSFDQYLSADGQGAREVEQAPRVSDDEYRGQTGREHRLRG